MKWNDRRWKKRLEKEKRRRYKLADKSWKRQRGG